ncbi:hypothetical protein [Streptomyces canus]|uniref:hypothetical protein n=1 Tax=Streptomyces canus TaxID=58343 RepID=UPI002E35CCF3|nr:hypothetical protein [Streptomyces canus]
MPKSIGGVSVTDETVLAMAPHLLRQQMSLREIAAMLVITQEEGPALSLATVMRMLREHDEQTAVDRGE